MPGKTKRTVIRLDGFLPYQVSLLADRVARRSTAVARQHGGLNLSHWRVLAAIAEAPGRTANQVVSVTPMDKGIVSRAVKSLIDLNLVAREGSREDGRVGHLFLTASGERRYQQMAREIRGVEALMTAPLSAEERRVLVAGLRKMATALKHPD